MRKLFLLVAAFCAASVAMAADIAMFNNEGNVEIEIACEKSQADAFKAVQAWYNTADMLPNTTKGVAYSEEADKSIHFSSGFNTQFRYNPFAGSFTETLLIEGDVVCEDGKLSLKLSEMVIVYVYAGYGVKQERKTIAQMKEEIAANDAIQADATAKKKAKKEAKNNNKDLTESLQSAIDEIAKRIIDPLTAAVNK